MVIFLYLIIHTCKPLLINLYFLSGFDSLHCRRFSDSFKDKQFKKGSFNAVGTPNRIEREKVFVVLERIQLLKFQSVFLDKLDFIPSKEYSKFSTVEKTPEKLFSGFQGGSDKEITLFK